MPPTTNRQALHELLTAAFDNSDLTTLAFIVLPDVHSQFSPAMASRTKIEMILDGALRHGRIPDLLAYIERENHYQFQQCAPRLGQTTAVGLYPSGRQPHLNLYDMSGNVWEWCQNKYEGPTQDGVDGSGDSRVWRGGSWHYAQVSARAAFRRYHHPNYRLASLGLRLVRCVSSSISS